jgi:hypothetical protein
MTPAAAVLAFRAALERRSWQEAADLVHPDDARRRQREDINRLAAALAASGFRRKQGLGKNALLIVTTDPTRPHQYLEEFRDSSVTSFPTGPRLGELAALPPNVYLARSFEAQAAHGERYGEAAPKRVHIEVVRIVEEPPDVAHVELRAPELISDDENGLVQVTLRLDQGEWRLQLEPDAFMPPLP